MNAQMKFVRPAAPKEIYDSGLPQNPWTDHKKGMDKRHDPLPDLGGAALIYRDFLLSELPRAASVVSTALGVFELFCNGRRVGRAEGEGVVYDEMKPGCSFFVRRALSYTYDLTPYLREGENRLLCVLCGGWYTGRIAFGTFEGKEAAFAARITLDDGERVEVIDTDETWTGTFGGQVRFSDIWDGELRDMRQPSYESISEPSFAAGGAPVIRAQEQVTVSPHIGPTIRLRPALSPAPLSVTVWKDTADNGTDWGEIVPLASPAPGTAFELPAEAHAVYDLGQNMVGRTALRLRGAAGTRVCVTYGEMLNDSGDKGRGNDGPKGSPYVANYRSAKAKNEFVLSGDEEGDLCETLLSFFGFRYFSVSAEEDVTVLDARAVVMGTENREVGRLETSNEEVNRLLSNIRWGMRGNYLSIPTDCPQRDERLGWTGDTQIFCRAGAYQADVRMFFHKWMQDVRDSQQENGAIPDVIPAVKIFLGHASAAAWGDAAIVVPYTIWQMYGDASIIRENMGMMKRYMAWIDARPDYTGPEPRYLDWLAFEPTEGDYIAMCYYAYDAKMLAEMADAIGQTAYAEEMRTRFGEVKAAFGRKHLDENGQPKQTTQTAYLLALYVGLLPDEAIPAAVEALKNKIVENGYRLSTGFVGTGCLCQALSAVGLDGPAYSLLLQTECPSWLYSVRQGATTVWERWNSYTKADGFGDVSMNSFNHYAYGAVAEWMYRTMAGIEVDPLIPGFAHVLLQPRPDLRKDEELPEGQERITWVRATYDTKHGEIASAWRLEEGVLTYECAVPDGTWATVTLPLCGATVYRENGTPTKAAGEVLRRVLPAGRYTFEIPIQIGQ
ncbi:MAG: family 78 glycoside hydrolase catalytic domain [Clostridia bacterium]|nr:family 78 glycoside hydrolase catalytic domain [Clostridia bacterium]